MFEEAQSMGVSMKIAKTLAALVLLLALATGPASAYISENSRQGPAPVSVTSRLVIDQREAAPIQGLGLVLLELAADCLFITKDPIGFEGGNNLFNYVNNNPVRWLDQFGLSIENIERAADYLSCTGLAQYITLSGILQGDPYGKVVSVFVTLRDGQVIIAPTLPPNVQVLLTKAYLELRTHLNEVSHRIGSGHAYENHRDEFREFFPGIMTKTQFGDFIFNIMTSVTRGNFKNFGGSKTALWDDPTETIVIYHPWDFYGDDGTALRPDDKRQYYNRLR